MSRNAILIVFMIISAVVLWFALKPRAIVAKPATELEIYPTELLAASDYERAVRQAELDTSQTGVEHYVALTTAKGYHSATWEEMLEKYGPL